MATPTTETAAIRQVIRALSQAGFTVDSVWNGEEEIKVSGESSAIEEIMNVDEGSIYFVKDGKEHGIFIVLGNSPEDTIADWHCGNEEFDKAVSDTVFSWGE